VRGLGKISASAMTMAVALLLCRVARADTIWFCHRRNCPNGMKEWRVVNCTGHTV